jgi:hypothetical protein
MPIMTGDPVPPSPTPPKAGPAVPPKPAAPQSPVVEIGGRKGPEPTRYGDWELNGRCIDF